MKKPKRERTQRGRLLYALWPYARPFRWKIILALSLLLVDTLTSLAAPWPIKLIFDNVLLKAPLQSPWSSLIPAAVAQNRLLFLVVLCGSLLVFALITAETNYLGMRLLAVIGQRVIFRLRCTLFTHFQQLSPSFYDRQRLGDLLTRLTSDVQAIQDMLVIALPMLLLSSMIVIGMIILLLVINPIFGLLGLVIAIGLYLILRKYFYAIKKVVRQSRRQEGNANAVAQEHLLGIRVVQAFGMEAHAKKRYEESATQIMQLGEVIADLESSMPSVVGLMTDVGSLLVMGIGGLLIIGGLISIGDLLVLSSYLRTMYKPMRQLSKLSNTFTRATASAERVIELLQTVPGIIDRPDARPVPSLQGAIAFRNVNFGYDPGQPVLHDLCFTIQAGMTVALVGQSGAGKSTILHLLQRFYDPQEGCVCVDGKDIREYTLASIRQQIALVPQDPMLFHASIRENIAYGNPQATENAIIAAAKMANADEFINRLPEGYDSVLEERGIGLSGGQRQRLAIARAMVRRAPILLLDEPTVGLDAQSEHSVVQALQRLMVGRTTLVSAHRLSTIQQADLILVIENGRIVEAGTHTELLAARGNYYQFYSLQFRYQDANELLVTG